MRSYRSFLIFVSLVFVVFSAVYGAKYAKLREDWRGHLFSSPGEAERDQRQMARIEAEQNGIHAIVKPVSIAYYLLCLGFFVRVRRVSPWRKLSIFGAVACVVMTLWSMIVGRGASFDEVYPAWIVAAIVLVILQLVVLPPAAVEEKAAA